MKENNSTNSTSPWALFKNTVGGFICIIVIALVFLCPALELTKIILFKQASNEITSKEYSIEFIYLSMVLIFPIGLIITIIKDRCCNMKGLVNYVREIVCCLPFFVLIISSIYTHTTSQEIKPIPDSCPSDYPYILSITRTACLIRLINFTAMWTFTSLLFFLSIAECFGCFPRKEKDSKDRNIEKHLSVYFSADRDDL